MCRVHCALTGALAVRLLHTSASEVLLAAQRAHGLTLESKVQLGHHSGRPWLTHVFSAAQSVHGALPLRTVAPSHSRNHESS